MGNIVGSGFTVPALETPKILNPAEWMYERVVKSIIAFEEALDDDKEVGARLVNFSASEIISVEDVGYWGPDIIIFYGKNADGSKIELIQHLSQLNLLLVAVKKQTETPRRIGFMLQMKLEEGEDET